MDKLTLKAQEEQYVRENLGFTFWIITKSLFNGFVFAPYVVMMLFNKFIGVFVNTSIGFGHALGISLLFAVFQGARYMSLQDAPSFRYLAIDRILTTNFNLYLTALIIGAFLPV